MKNKTHIPPRNHKQSQNVNYKQRKNTCNLYPGNKLICLLYKELLKIEKKQTQREKLGKVVSSQFNRKMKLALKHKKRNICLNNTERPFLIYQDSKNSKD